MKENTSSLLALGKLSEANATKSEKWVRLKIENNTKKIVVVTKYEVKEIKI